MIGAFILSAVYEMLASSISTAAALFFGLVIVARGDLHAEGLVDLGGGLRADAAGAICCRTSRQYRL